jgi:hypothetical protein
VGVVLFVMLGVVGASVLEGARPSPTAAPSVAAGLAASTTPTATSAATPSMDAGGLTADEQALRARIPTDFQRFCLPSSLPDGSLGGDVASFKCELPVGTDTVFGANTVWYDQFGTPGTMAAAVNTVVNREGLPTVRGGSDLAVDDCTSGAGKALGTWKMQITFSGVEACYPKDGAAWTLWTYGNQQIAVRAVRKDGDAARLFAWQHDTAGYLK